MVNNTNFESITAYQLSLNINEDYRAVRKILEDFNGSGIVEVVGQSGNSSKAPLYKVNELVKENIVSILQARKANNASASNKDVERNLKRLQDFQALALESEKTIKSLNELIVAKDKELQQLTNNNIILDADLKIAKSELKLITDKSSTIEANNARLVQELGAAERKIRIQNRWLIISGAFFLIVLCYFVFSFIFTH